MTANPIASMTSDTLIIAEASADELRLTIEHLHTRLAIARAEAESHLERIDAVERDAAVKASQRDTFERALAHEREAGRGLVAQVEALRAVSAATARACDAAIARAEKAEADRAATNQEIAKLHAVIKGKGFSVEDSIACAEMRAEIAKLRAEVAELRARPVLTVEMLAGTSICLRPGAYSGIDAARREAEKIIDVLGTVTLPSPDRAEELTKLISGQHYEEVNDAVWRGMVERTRAALAKFSPAPAREAAPTLVAVSDEELAKAFETAAIPSVPYLDRITAGIRAVRAKLGAAEVAEERVKAALCEHFKYEGHRDWSADARAILAYLRATAAKGGES